MSWSKNVDWSIYDEIPKGIEELYLKKLGLEKETPSLEYLNELTRRHQLVFPYENLDITLLDKGISLLPEKMVEKMLVGNRGGYCFELNGLFRLLLAALGFDSLMCMCRQLRHGESSAVPATHCGVLTYMDNEIWFSDVGYGGPVPLESIKVQTESIQYIAGKKFVFRHCGLSPNDTILSHQKYGWLVLDRFWNRNGVEQVESVIQMLPAPCYLKDFCGGNLLRGGGDSGFAVSQVNLITENGYRNLTGNVVHIRENGIDEIINFSDEEMPTILKKYFNIVL